MSSRPPGTLIQVPLDISPPAKTGSLTTNLIQTVIFGGGEEYTVVGKGNIQIQSARRNLMFLDVYRIPGMELNLLSVSQMLRHSPRLDITFSSHQCTITDRETRFFVAVGLEDQGLFRLADSGTSQDLGMAARQSSVSTLWHQHYGHLNARYLSQLARDKLVLGLSEIPTQLLGVCDACQDGKQHRTPFPVGNSWRASQVLQLVHADICGPMATPSVLGSRYFLLFVDDFSRKMWVYFLKKKLEAFIVFQKFKPLVKKEWEIYYCS